MDGCCTLVAVMVTPFCVGRAAGAVYWPQTIVPKVLLPPLTPSTDQVTLALNEPVPATCAVNSWLAPVRTAAELGVTVTEVISGGGGGGGGGD